MWMLQMLIRMFVDVRWVGFLPPCDKLLRYRFHYDRKKFFVIDMSLKVLQRRHQFRVILIGDSTVGKSSLLRYFTDGTFAEVSDPTVGVDFFARLVRLNDGTTVKLQLWDTAGQVRTWQGHCVSSGKPY
jgi:Ras family